MPSPDHHSASEPSPPAGCVAPSDDAADRERLRAFDIVRRYGAHATSFPLLEDGLQYFFCAETGGLVAYVRSGRHRVVAGPPVAAPGLVARTAQLFADDARACGERVVFFWVDEAFCAELTSSIGEGGFAQVPIGAQPEWDPTRWSTEGSRKATLRAQMKRAARKGVSVRRVDAAAVRDQGSAERRAIASVVARWLSTRAMSTMRFLVDVQPFGFAGERRYYLATHRGLAVAAVVAVPVYARQGFFLEDVLRAPDAPNGTVELLIDHAMRDLAEGGARYATLGLAPLAQVSTAPGPHRALRRALAFSFLHFGVLYPFATLLAFKQRFVPDLWALQHMVVIPPRAPALALAHVLRAFTGMRMLAFAIASIRRLLARALARVARLALRSDSRARDRVHSA